ncbi:hypothetical protein DID88_005523 [Monilinia fructigena]|uniref:Carboxylic ester hydrolase n=1 Tax=Monilinia fructigena TaxID=38457 RepID=A0A395J037_9HELO|nr:hypothetical protein DID88_005523 [Monilinia fructigena]
MGGFVSAVAATSMQNVSMDINSPTVDLGYSIHQATLNSSGQYPYLNFSNIRYGHAPVGSLRFAAPESPRGRNATINDGQHDSICPQALPAWLLTAEDFLGNYLTGQNISSFTDPIHEMTVRSTALSVDPRSNEDCLFLDVIVPQKIFNATNSTETVTRNAGNKAGAPVLVWIHGGGYVYGSKTSSGNPASLVAASLENEKEGMIYVAMNYRLGLFGWLAGDSKVTANAGLLDQRLALEWVQTNINLFGGDPNRVTVMGESAGAGSILHHITAYGGTKDRAPFQRAIPQSPAFIPIVPSQEKALFREVIGNASLLSNTTVKTVGQLKNLPYKVLSGVNMLLTGRNANEGLIFTNPAVQTQSEYISTLEQALPSADASVIFHLQLANVLYPPIYNGSYGYTSSIERLALSISHFTIACNAYSLVSAPSKISPRNVNASSPSSSYAYLFSIPPGIHGLDVPYTFFNGDTAGGTLQEPPVMTNIATALQRFLTEFVISGDPSSSGVFVEYDKNDTVTSIGIAGLKHVGDPAADSRCDNSRIVVASHNEGRLMRAH